MIFTWGDLAHWVPLTFLVVVLRRMLLRGRDAAKQPTIYRTFPYNK